METSVIVKVVFEGWHCWPDAPKEVGWLRNLHRHLFVVRAKKEVFHSDRDVEFISFGWGVGRKLGEWYPSGDMGSTSCEMLARRLVEELGLRSCTVMEDDENGAEVVA